MLHHGWRLGASKICAFSLVLTSVLLGCGGGGEQGPKLSAVNGTVTLDGAPLRGAGVTFHPDTGKGNKAEYLPAGVADEKGKYKLITATKDGAPAGWYKVVITAPVPPRTGGEAPKVGPPPFNVKFIDVGSTDLSVEVKDGAAAGSYDLKLTK